VVGGDNPLDRPRRSAADLALYLAQQHPWLREVYPPDGLQVRHWLEQAGPEGGTMMNGHL
jgi:hypothetical protein